MSVHMLTPCASSPGRLQMSLYLANNNNGGELDIQFSGKFLQAKDDLDVIAIFDGSCFRLEQLCGQIKAKCVLAAGAAALCLLHACGPPVQPGTAADMSYTCNTAAHMYTAAHMPPQHR